MHRKNFITSLEKYNLKVEVMCLKLIKYFFITNRLKFPVEYIIIRSTIGDTYYSIDNTCFFRFVHHSRILANNNFQPSSSELM